MEVLTRHFVAVATADFYQDKFGRVFVAVEFCRRAVMQIEPETLEDEPIKYGLPSYQEPELRQAERMPAGLEWQFDDDVQTARYGSASIVFRGAIQYNLLKMTGAGTETQQQRGLVGYMG